VTVLPGSGPSNGQILGISNGIVTYLPNANYFGTDSFRYTIRDNDGFESLPATVTITITEVPDYRNPLLSADVNKSGQITPIDALIVINYVNSNPDGSLPPDPIPPAVPEYYYDVNGDGRVNAQDVLIIVNILNTAAQSGGEGESAAMPNVAPLPRTLPDADAGLHLLAVPDYTQFARATGEAATAMGRILGVSAARSQKSETVWPATDRSPATGAQQDAWFHRVGADAGALLDVALSDALDDIADRVSVGFDNATAADWVLSGANRKA